MVTADSISHTYAVIIWEKVVTDEIDSFYIYRSNVLGLYEKIGATHYSQPGEFWDFGVDLNQNINGLYKYKMSALDTCGNESLKSRYHKPIHLLYLGLGNFMYDDYKVELITPNYPFELYSDFTGTGTNWTVINSTSSGDYDMDDLSYLSHSNAVYHVRAILPVPCDPTRTGVNTSRSNIKNQTISNNIEELQNVLLKVYPNPATDVLFLEGVNGLKISKINIFNSLGQIVLSFENDIHSILLNDLEIGVFYLELHTNAGIMHRSFIKN
jgi:hypothetical protein